MVYSVDSNGCVHVSRSMQPVQRCLAHKRAKEPLRVKHYASPEAARKIIRDWVASHS